MFFQFHSINWHLSPLWMFMIASFHLSELTSWLYLQPSTPLSISTLRLVVGKRLLKEGQMKPNYELAGLLQIEHQLESWWYFGMEVQRLLLWVEDLTHFQHVGWFMSDTYDWQISPLDIKVLGNWSKGLVIQHNVQPAFFTYIIQGNTKYDKLPPKGSYEYPQN